MSNTLTSTITRMGMNKLIIGFIIFAAAALMGASVMAGATPNQAGAPVTPPTSKEQCRNGGWQNFKDAEGKMAFKNQGQCIGWVATHGHGYGGGGSQGPIINFGNIIVSISNTINTVINTTFNFIFNFGR